MFLFVCGSCVVCPTAHPAERCCGMCLWVPLVASREEEKKEGGEEKRREEKKKRKRARAVEV